MPIYEYLCEDCNHKFEKLVLSKAVEIVCPNCGGKRNRFVFSVFRMGIGAGNEGSIFSQQADVSSCCAHGTCTCRHA